jgi:Cellulase (glycosyl hydrolase family 5)
MLNKLLITLATSSVLATAVATAPAHASTRQESIFQDDSTLVFEGDAKRQQALDEIKALGATTIHTLVFWNRIAPDPNSKTRPAGFDATNPDAYPPGAFAPYDQLIGEAQARGLQVILSPVEAPAWAGGCGSIAVRHHCKPSPKEYGQFLTALGKRYPTVHRWSFWNEPNQSNWLYPQRQKVHGHIIPTAAIIYRNLFRAGTAALQATGHGGDQFLLGETAPLGRTTGPLGKRFLSPTEFFQGVFCLSSRGHKLRGRIAKDEGCTGYKKLAATGISHHPYNRGGSQPPTRRPSGPGEITVANLSRLSSVINEGSRAHRIRGGLKFYFTEFGFQSNPPDHTFGVSLSRQARYINESEYITYKNRRVAGMSQYELFDAPLTGDFNTGLRLKNGKAKPALGAYRLPIWVTRSGSGVRVWGAVRPADGTPQTVQIQNGNKKFKTVKTVRTSSNGYFLVRVGRKAGAKWRLAWNGFTSRAAGIGT